MRISEWPRTSMTTRGWTPSDSGSVAAVCRPSWCRTSRASASFILPGAPVRLPLDRPPVGLREDQVVALPERAGRDPLLELGGSVGSQRLDELPRQRQRPPAAVGLRLLVDQALLRDPVQATPNGQRPAVEVDVGPPETERFRDRGPPFPFLRPWPSPRPRCNRWFANTWNASGVAIVRQSLFRGDVPARTGTSVLRTDAGGP